MLFNSLSYFLFLPVVVLAYHALRGRAKMVLLCAASLFFYSMWRVDFTFLMVFTAMVDYVAAHRIAATDVGTIKRRWLITALTINIGLLVFFKYTYFLVDNVGRLAGTIGWGFDHASLPFTILLPIGISFYTFHSISYTIDVYRGVYTPKEDFLTFLTYVGFWPQLVAGPILRAGEVLPQLQRYPRPDRRMVASGISLVLIGLFKKIVVADNLASSVDFLFGESVAGLSAIDVWTAAFLFGMQIYCDFSGYSDIAIGSALLVGLRFPENFNWPYAATSPREFWRRWHISLSSWIRDYLYVPLTGAGFQTKSVGGLASATQEADGRRNVALLITWTIMGLWHGAAWTFVMWGLYHCALILLYRRLAFLGRLEEQRPLIAWSVALPLLMAGWLPFRATSVQQAGSMMLKLVNPLEYHLSYKLLNMSDPRIIWAYMSVAVCAAGMVAVFLMERILTQRRIPGPILVPARVAFYGLVVAAVLIYMGNLTQFIYFVF
jgi:alginate O-acetyltransferase complex protein AlgI